MVKYLENDFELELWSTQTEMIVLGTFYKEPTIAFSYFDIVNKNRNEGNDYVYSINNILGLSNQFSALKTIVEVFISLIEPNIKILTGTIQGNIYVHAGSYIAGAILASSKCGFEESDIYGNSIPYDKIIETISSKNLQYVLMGIE